MAVVALGELDEIERDIYHNLLKSHRAAALRDEVQTGIQTYGVVFTPNYGYVYAYEVDGLNHANLMDDANIPSLLSAPYIGYTKATSLHRQAGTRDRLAAHQRRLGVAVGDPHARFHRNDRERKARRAQRTPQLGPRRPSLTRVVQSGRSQQILARRLRLAQRALQRIRDDRV